MRAFAVTLLLTSACTVRNPSYQPEPEVKDAASAPFADHRATARTDLPGLPVPDPDAGSSLDADAPDRATPDAFLPDLLPHELGAVEKPTCLPDEHSRGDRCYAMLSPFAPVGQKVAAQLCADRGATLASIGTTGENAFLYGLLPSTAQAVWLGLVRTGPGKKDFAWASGEPFGFASWAPGEPNNTGGVEDCVVLWGPALADPKLRGNWNDAPCAFPRDLLLCERVLAP
ncbi:MAG: C-type lectin domain-containing protein [Acidobacteriota bacterium]